MKTLFGLAVLFLIGSSAVGAEPSPPQPTPEAIKAVELVRQLGDVNFRVRDAAAKELKNLGLHAKTALLEGAKSRDPEVSNRCAQLLPELMALDLKSRVDAFLADVDGKQQHDLPMVMQFRKLVGNDAATRKMYAGLLTTNVSFLEACVLEPKLTGVKFDKRVVELSKSLIAPGAQVAQVNVADIAALFLVGALGRMDKEAENHGIQMAHILSQPTFMDALRKGEQAVPLRKLFFAWGENCEDGNALIQALVVIKVHKMKDGLDFVAKAAKMKAQPLWIRAQAVTLIGEIGGKENLPALEALFDDTATFGKTQWKTIAMTTQINDVALAMAVHLSGQKHKDYEFGALASEPILIWVAQCHGFTTDEKRTAAFKRYQDWKAAQKKEPHQLEKK